MNEQAYSSDSDVAGTDTTTSPGDGAPAATCGVDQQAFVPAGVYATCIGGRRALWPVAVGAVSFTLAAMKLLTVIGHILQLGFSVVLGGGSSFGGVLSGDLLGMVAMSTYLLGGVIGALLLPAGLLVWRQSRLGPGMHKAYAIIAILLNATFPLVQFFTYPESYRMQFVFWPIWSATMGMVYPVFLLVWFSRPKVKAETRLWR